MEINPGGHLPAGAATDRHRGKALCVGREP